MNPFVIGPLDLVLRLTVSLLLGGIIGYERERNSRPAGFRTHILVCVGSTLLMLISAYAFGDFAGRPGVQMDPTRLAAQVIPSIGFLGAGTILRNDFSVTGLTTAASLWVASAIGLAVGVGFYWGALTATALVLISLYILNKVEKKFITGSQMYILKVVSLGETGIIGNVSTKLTDRRVTIKKLAILEEVRDDKPVFEIILTIKLPRKLSIVELSEEVKKVAGTLVVTTEIG
jgi:putative Mg2+ transporter-C (MgtC) family protein